MRRLPLRWLILIPTLVTVTVGFAAFSFYVERTVHQDLIAGVDAELTRAEQGGAGRANPPAPSPTTAPDVPIEPADEGDESAAPVELVLTATGAVVEQNDRANPFDEAALAGIASLADGDHIFDDPAFRVRTTRQADGTVVVTALDLTNVNATIANLRRALLGGAVVILALQALAVAVIASFLSGPLARMTVSARRIAGGDLDTTIGEPHGSRETVELAADLDRMLHRLRATVDSSERSAAAATQARADMARFLADASHELRTPLTALKGYSDLYAGNMLGQPGDLDRAMSRIGSESERMTRLVNDMLQLARSGDTRRTTPHTLVDLTAVVADVVDDLRAADPDTAIGYAASSSRCEVLADRDQLHQAVLNLASNACRHSDAGQPVTIALGEKGNGVELRVVDHGPGVDARHVDQIFLPFYRVDASRSRDGDGHAGAGLGLAVTKQIIDDHEGTVAVEPTPDGGATFVVTLPAAP